jgi:hypothetical protein
MARLAALLLCAAAAAATGLASAGAPSETQLNQQIAID